MSFERKGPRSWNWWTTRTHITDKHQDLWDQRSRSQGHVVRLTFVIENESHRNSKIGGNVGHTTYIKVHNFQGQKIKGQGHRRKNRPINAHIVNARTEREGLQTSNLVGGWSMRYQMSWPATKALRPVKLGYCTQAGHTVSASPSGHITSFKLGLAKTVHFYCNLESSVRSICSSYKPVHVSSHTPAVAKLAVVASGHLLRETGRSHSF